MLVSLCVTDTPRESLLWPRSPRDGWCAVGRGIELCASGTPVCYLFCWHARAHNVYIYIYFYKNAGLMKLEASDDDIVDGTTKGNKRKKADAPVPRKVACAS